MHCNTHANSKANISMHCNTHANSRSNIISVNSNTHHANSKSNIISVNSNTHHANSKFNIVSVYSNTIMRIATQTSSLAILMRTAKQTSSQSTAILFMHTQHTTSILHTAPCAPRAQRIYIHASPSFPCERPRRGTGAMAQAQTLQYSMHTGDGQAKPHPPPPQLPANVVQ